jgi:hypothetical protein
MRHICGTCLEALGALIEGGHARRRGYHSNIPFGIRVGPLDGSGNSVRSEPADRHIVGS